VPTVRSSNKLKILNDPIYGFISIPNTLIFDLIEHPYFQRLRRIKQLGLTSYVYPGALHTRFHHAIGAMHLMSTCILTLRKKGTEITSEEEEAVLAAILLHDIGHGPFSHALEELLIPGMSHEKLSALLMEELNHQLSGRLNLCIEIFNNTYHKKFLHQLVSSQLDMDRLDYLKRDSFFTGVSEGIISTDRIIAMLNVINDTLVVEEKGIYSIEKFIIARRLMYWQVYLHKTVLSAENMLVKIILRARQLLCEGKKIFTLQPLNEFLEGRITKASFRESSDTLLKFTQIDDDDVFACVKQWQFDTDKVLSTLSRFLLNRNLFNTEISKEAFNEEHLESLSKLITTNYQLNDKEIAYFLIQGKLQNNAYNAQKDRINIYYKNGQILDIAQAADQLNISALSAPVEKFFLCYPKDCLI
jgi:uncharacterized protein